MISKLRIKLFEMACQVCQLSFEPTSYQFSLLHHYLYLTDMHLILFFLVFMWVPSLIKVNGTESLPTGLVFSSFMLAMTFGGMLFSLLLPIFPGGAEGSAVIQY